MAAQESLAAAKLTVSKAREATEKYQSALTEKDAELKALQKELNALVRGLLPFAAQARAQSRTHPHYPSALAERARHARVVPLALTLVIPLLLAVAQCLLRCGFDAGGGPSCRQEGTGAEAGGPRPSARPTASAAAKAAVRAGMGVCSVTVPSLIPAVLLFGIHHESCQE